jgi:Arc/MetJ-type ribon-helix-helix transcriptional regulator
VRLLLDTGVLGQIFCHRYCMARHLDPADLPENVALYAQAQVTAGRFACVEDVLSAGVEALQERDRAEQEWLAYARREAEDGFAELDRGEGIHGTAAEHMARIDAAVRSRAT